MSGLTRYCRACYATNEGNADFCGGCNAPLRGEQLDEDFDDQLIWALAHPDTATSERAAQILAQRHVERAVPALLSTASLPDPYRAAAAAHALLEFDEQPRVRAELALLRRYGPLLVRRALGRAGSHGRR